MTPAREGMWFFLNGEGDLKISEFQNFFVRFIANRSKFNSLNCPEAL